MGEGEAWTRGVHHVGLTVPDIEETRAFFVDALGFREVGRKPGYPAVFVSDGVVMLTIWQARNPADCVAFDRKANVGLHHLALRVDVASLDALHERLRAWAGVEVEFAPEPLGTAGTRHMMLSVPGGVRLELIAPAS